MKLIIPIFFLCKFCAVINGEVVPYEYLSIERKETALKHYSIPKYEWIGEGSVFFVEGIRQEVPNGKVYQFFVKSNPKIQ